MSHIIPSVHMIYSENHHAEDRRACAVEKNGDWYRSKRHLYKSQVSQCLLVTSPLWTKSTMVAQSNPHVLGGGEHQFWRLNPHKGGSEI